MENIRLQHEVELNKKGKNELIKMILDMNDAAQIAMEQHRAVVTSYNSLIDVSNAVVDLLEKHGNLLEKHGIDIRKELSPEVLEKYKKEREESVKNVFPLLEENFSVVATLAVNEAKTKVARSGGKGKNKKTDAAKKKITEEFNNLPDNYFKEYGSKKRFQGDMHKKYGFEKDAESKESFGFDAVGKFITKLKNMKLNRVSA